MEVCKINQNTNLPSQLPQIGNEQHRIFSTKDTSYSMRTTNQNKPSNSSSIAQCSFGQSIVNMQNPNKDEICKTLETIVFPYTIYRYHNPNNNNSPIRAKAGSEIPHWSQLYNENVNLTVYLDKNREIEEIYVQNIHSKMIDVFDKKGEVKKTFSSSDIESLFEYKYFPQNFHKYLRLNKLLPTKTETELLKHINTIDNCFKEKNKVFKTENETIVYRALPEYLTNEELITLNTVGAVYEDKSFVSTTQKLDTAKRFSGGKTPIMEITLPKDSSYLDLDRLFNIDRHRWNEQEFLLKRGSKFLITGYDKDKNTIKAQYINE